MSASEAPVLEGVREVIAVHSAKGGVGKSTTAANLAVTFAKLGLDVGLLDLDIHGPSVALLMGDAHSPLPANVRGKVLPRKAHGVKFLSMANVAADDAPIIWRGPMVAGALRELLTLVHWGDLDVLVLDLPPGTGDVLIGLGQSVTLSGVVTVSTPQEVSLMDTRRGIRGFEQLQVPTLGLVENLSGFVCDECGDIAPLFGEGTVERVAEELGLPFLARIPIDPLIRAGADEGKPAPIVAGEDRPAVRAYDSLARAVLAQLSRHGRATGTFDVTWRAMPPGELHRDPPGDAPPATDDPDRPVAVWQASAHRLGIRWGDGSTTFHGAYELRRACPCASCVDEWTREELPSLDRVPKDVVPGTVRSVGRYALQPVWSDGHRTGIYSFRDLRGGLAVVPD